MVLYTVSTQPFKSKIVFVVILLILLLTSVYQIQVDFDLASLLFSMWGQASFGFVFWLAGG